MNVVVDRLKTVGYGFTGGRCVVAEVEPVVDAAEHSIQASPNRLVV